ncbi:MAG: hypothetical protein AAGD96_30780 [Chloroflexota bacterium]
MNTITDSTNRSLLKIGGWSAIASGGFYVLVTIYIFGVLPQYGFITDMFDDHTLLHPWVAEYPRLYQVSWILYFFTQLCLLPVPIALANFFSTAEDDSAKALVKLSPLFGMVAIPLAMLSSILFYATSPITAQAYVEMASSGETQSVILTISGLMTDTAKEIRLFSEIGLAIWLVSTGYLFYTVRNMQGISWVSFGIGLWTLFVVVVKFFNPYAPLEDALGILLGLAYTIIGIHQIRFVNSASNNAPVLPAPTPESLSGEIPV